MGLNAAENMGAGLFSCSEAPQVPLAHFYPLRLTQIRSGELDRGEVLGVVRSAWLDSIEAADAFYEPGKFTTFAAYEYTSSTGDMGNSAQKCYL